MRKLPAGVRRRKTGLLEKRFSLNGCRYSVYGRTVRELNDREQQKRSILKAEAPFKRNNMTLDQYFESWIEEKRLSVKPSTIRIYTTYYRPYAAPVIGAILLTELTRRDIVRVQCEAAKRISPTTNNILLTVLKTILNGAVEDRLIPENPARGVKPVKTGEKAVDTYHRALTNKEQGQFMTAAREDYYYELLAFQLLTGMRLGEIGALYWDDIDEEMNVIHVRRTITRTEKGIFYIGDSTKTEAGVRDIPINDGIRNILASQRRKQDRTFRKKQLSCGIDCQSDDKKHTDGEQCSMSQRLCFRSPTGRMICHSPVNRSIRRILGRLEEQGIHIKPFTSHALRDTFATRYIEQGGNPQTLKTILGHSSLSMTMDLYSHVMPDTKQEEMNRIVILV